MKKFVLLLMICVLGIHVFAGDIDEAQVPKVVKECETGVPGSEEDQVGF